MHGIVQCTEKNSFSWKKLSLLTDNTRQGWAQRNFIISNLQRHPEHTACELTALLKPLPKDEPVCLNPSLTIYPWIKPLSSCWLLPANPGCLSPRVGSLFLLLLFSASFKQFLVFPFIFRILKSNVWNLSRRTDNGTGPCTPHWSSQQGQADNSMAGCSIAALHQVFPGCSHCKSVWQLLGEHMVQSSLSAATFVNPTDSNLCQ